MKFVTVFIAYNLVEAEMVKDALEAEGIQAIVLNKNMGTLYPHAGAMAIQVQVHLKDEKMALQILQELKGLNAL